MAIQRAFPGRGPSCEKSGEETIRCYAKIAPAARIKGSALPESLSCPPRDFPEKLASRDAAQMMHTSSSHDEDALHTISQIR